VTNASESGQYPAVDTQVSLRDAVAEAHRRSAELREQSTEVLARAEQTIAEIGASGVGNDRVASLTREVQGLRQAMESRAVIEQAKGIIMGATGCDADAAFGVLSKQSQYTNRKLRDVAEELVAQKTRRRNSV
jgi:hypothetical protein